MVYTLNTGDMNSSCALRATSSLREAMTVEAGWPRTISRARFGPDSTAMRSWSGSGSSSSITSVMRLADSISRPLVALRTIEPLARCGHSLRMFSRSVRDGTDTTTMSASGAASSRDAVTLRPSGNVEPEGSRGLSRACSSAVASSSVRAHSSTSEPLLARRMASVVPQLVVPTTVTLAMRPPRLSPASRSVAPTRRASAPGP